jgi:hypothetical protein
MTPLQRSVMGILKGRNTPVGALTALEAFEEILMDPFTDRELILAGTHPRRPGRPRRAWLPDRPARRMGADRSRNAASRDESRFQLGRAPPFLIQARAHAAFLFRRATAETFCALVEPRPAGLSRTARLAALPDS